MKDKRIRFIDSNYNTLFTIADGESIIVKSYNGHEDIRKCEYIDDYHTLIGSSVFHICQYAEICERNGATYRPAKEA